MFCVYLTTYSGNKLPMFYIGSTSTNKIFIGYRGSVMSKEYKSIWKSELLNNPHLFKTQIILKCKTRKEAFLKERSFQLSLNMSTSPMYINKAIAGSNFMFTRQHSNYTIQLISSKLKDKVKTIEHRMNISKSLLNKAKSDSHKESLKTAWKSRSPHTQEHKDRIGLVRKGIKRSAAVRQNISNGKKGKPQQQVTCPHCKKIGGISAMKTYHFDNCKYK
jgi:hypothetical protein